MANVPDSTLELIYQDIINCAQYKLPWPVGPHSADKRKVSRRRAGEATSLPSGRLARAAWRTAAALAPLAAPPPPPPPPPPQNVAPRTYNGMPDGTEPNARFCVTGLPTEGAYRRDAFTRYDEDGRDVDGGRSNKQVAGLKPANQMDGRGPCDAYGPFPPWPAQSYER